MGSQIVSLTFLSSGVAFKLSANKIIQFESINSGSNSILTYLSDSEKITKRNVTQTATAINLASLTTITVTLLSGDVIYINIENICSISAQNSGSIIKYDSKREQFETIGVTQTPAALQILINEISESISTNTDITAHAGGGQANAVVLTAQSSVVTTVATTADSVKLTDAIIGIVKEVINDGANDMNLYPDTGDRFQTGGVLAAINAPVSIAAGTSFKFTCYVAGIWRY